MSLITVKCTYENNDTIVTDINGNLESAKEYFLNNYFNLGYISYDYEKDTEIEVDNIQKCIKVEEV